MQRHGIHSGSCSCTSCVYKSQSKRPSIQQLIQEGSKIDRLYFGKYLPLRERKLLEKLIRTRGVYDDVRNQLLSTSGSSDQTKSDHKMKRRDDDTTEKSSAVLKIVDLVDRGQIGSSNTSKLSSCCSCCSCSSLRKIKKYMEKHPPHVHRHHVPYEEIAKYCAEAEKRGKRRRKSLSTKISSKIRAVRFKVKQVRSDPCTCTLSLSSVAKRPSKAFIKQVRSKEKARANAQAQKVVTTERNALKKKICNCSCKIAKLPMKSIKKIKNIRKSTTKSSQTEMGTQRAFRIKKDSLTLFREKLQKKRSLRDWECEPGICVVDECIPEQCLVDIKARGVGETKRRKYHNRISGTSSDQTRISMSTRPKKVKKTDSKVQASPKSSLGPVTCECKPTSKSASSMTSFSKSKTSRPLVQIKSTTTEIKVKRPKSPKQKPQVMLEDTQAVSKAGIKRPGAPKPKPQIVIKETVIQEKAYKTDRHKPQEMQLVQTPTKSKLGHVICECKPSEKSTSSMTNISQSNMEINVKRPIKPKQKPQLVEKNKVIQEKVIQEKVMQEKVIQEKVIQEKAYKTDLHKPHEKEVVQAPPKSKLGHVICECKPSTRSTSSMTFTSKQSKTDMKVKRTKHAKREKAHKTSRYIPRKERYEYYETESKGDTKESGKQAVKLSSSFKFEIEFSKKRHPALTDKELFEHVKIKRAKRKNRRQGIRQQKIKYQHSKIQVSGTSSKGNRGTTSSQDSQISYLRDSTSQTSKYTSESLPFPRECDPLMCVPYECDPENCARILLSRSKSRGKPARSSTDRIRHKSAGSTTSSLKTSSKSKYIQSKSMETFTSKTKELPKERPHQRIEKKVRPENSSPQKQAVRIGSSFSFNIEFYKEKPPGAKINDTQDLKEIKPKVHRKKHKERGHGTRNKHIRHISSQSRSSQSIKNTQVGHKLKRCFCTLKLLQKKKPKVKHTVSKKTMAALHNKDPQKRARMRQTQTKSSGIAYVIPPITSPTPPLLPYECEPLFCTPGECNPYECAERIKVRNLNNGERNPYEGAERMKVRKYKKDYRSSSKETNTVSVPRKSALTFTSQASPKSSSRKIQSSSQEYRKQKTKRPHLSRTGTEVSSKKTEKQAVRIGSSFSFNIEFSKDKINQQGVHGIETTKTLRPDKPIKKERKRIQQKGIKVHKPRVRHATSEISKRVKTKQTYTPQFLQRCFCTLKLFNDTRGYVTRKPSREKPIRKHEHKKLKHTGSQQLKHRHHHKAMHTETKVKEKGIYVGSAIKRCFCTLKFHKKGKNERLQENNKVPNPQTCECKTSKTSHQMPKPQKRDHKSKKTSYEPPHAQPCVCKSTSTKRSKPTYDLKDYECAPDFCVPGMCNPYECYEEIKRRDTKPQNFDYKSTKTSYKPPNPQTCECKTSKTSYQPPSPQPCDCKTTSNKKSKPRYDLEDYECAPDFCVPGMCNPHECYEEIKRRDMKPQNFDYKSTKTSYKPPNPQTCECKTSKTSYQPPSLQPCECKSTSTKRSNPTYDLKNYECAPDFCVPGQCDPYECYKEIKKRDMKRIHDRSVCTERRKRRSIVSMTTTEYIGSSKSKSTQSRIVKQIPKHDHKVRVVRRDQRPTSSISPSRQAVRIGSNFSFNIEFFKDRSAPSVPDTVYKVRTPKYSTVSDTTTVKKRKHRGTKHKRTALQHRVSQASNIIRREDKASNVGFTLKRCFCTLGLQKKKIDSKQKREFRGNPPIAARFVQVRVDQNKNKTCTFEDPNVTKTQKLDIIKDYEIMKSRSSIPYRTLFAEECLQLNLQEGNRPFDKNIFRQHLIASSTFTKSTHVKSRIDFNIGILNNKAQATTPNVSEFDEFRNLLNDDIQKMNSFYQSFYALNLQVSNIKKLPVNTYALKDNECEPGVCIPYQCDPVECLKRINSRLQRSKSSGTARPKTKSVTSVTKSKLESKSRTTEANLKKYEQRPSQNNYSSNRNGQQKPTTPSSRQSLRVGSDFSFAMEFYKDTEPRIDDDMNTTLKKQNQTKDVATRNLQSRLHNSDTQINVERQNKATGLTPLLKRCFCTLKLKNNKVNRSKIKQKTESKEATTAGNIKKNKTTNKTEKNKTIKKNIKQKKDQSTMASKPYGNVIINENRKIMTDKLEPYECAPNICIPGECDARECYKLIQKRLKNLREHGVGTDNPKNKSTPSLAKRSKNKTTKAVQSKPKESTTGSKKIMVVPKQKFQSGALRPSEKQGVTFGSTISFKMEFYKDPNWNPSSSFSPASARSGAKSQVSPVCNTNMKGAGDNRKKTKDNGQTATLQPKMEEAGTNVAKMLNRCFCTLKLSKRGSKGISKKNKIKKEPVKATNNVKSILKPYECEPQSCVIDKCTPIECDKRIKKRRMRSKSTKVNRKREAKSVKSAVMDKGTATKGKRLSKSFECEPYTCIPDKCNPRDCIEKLNARGIIFPDASERASKKVKHTGLSTQKVQTKTKSINTDKESILKRCFCVLKFKKSKPPSSTLDDMKCEVCEPKTDLNKFIKKCFCTFKLVKGGKELTTKQSQERIVDVKNRDKLKKPAPKPALKMEKKGVDKNAVKKEKEMETLMPYSKKKFKKLESKTRVAQATTNTVGFYPCTCPMENSKQQNVCKTPNLKKKQDEKSSIHFCSGPNKQMGDQLDLCPACKTRTVIVKCNKKKDGKKSIPHCLCLNEQVGDQLDLCPVCKAQASAKYNKKKDGKKSNPFCVCSNDQVGDQLDPYPVCKAQCSAKNNKKKDKNKSKQLGDHSDLCPECTAYSQKYNKKKDGKISIQPCVCPNEQLEDQSDLCPTCKANTNVKKNKNKKPDKKKYSYSCPCYNDLCARQNTDIRDEKTCKKNNIQVLQNDNRSHCKFHENATQSFDKAKSKKQEKQTRADNNKKIRMQNCQLVCTCCNATMCCNPPPPKPSPPPSPSPSPSPFDTVMNIFKFKHSSFLIGRKSKEIKETIEIEKEVAPLFEVFVNKSTMNIINRDEVLANLGARRKKESAVMKKARIAGEEGKLCPPVMELLIDKDSATIVNTEELNKRSIRFEKRRNGRIRYGKSGGVKIINAKCQSLRAAETSKKPPVQTAKSERTAPLRHGASCQCCECLRKMYRVRYATLPVQKYKQKSGAGDGKRVGKDGKRVGKDGTLNGKDGKPVLINGKPVGKDGKLVGKDGKLIGKDGKPVEKDGTLIGKDGKPIERDGRLIGKDGKPIGKDGKPIGAKVAMKPRILKPCICGSIPCKKNWDKLKRHERSIKSMKIKPCVCGSDVCKYESQKMPDVLLKAAQKAQRYQEKVLQRIEDEKKYQQERLIRKKKYAEQDAKLWQKRKKRDRRDMRLVKKYEDNTPDCLKAAESLIDIGKFGAKAMYDLMRSTCRIIQHPRDGVYLIKDARAHPRRTAKEIEKSCEGMGFFATAARVRRRVFSMGLVKTIIAKLESYPITNFMVHMADKNPKKRMKKFKKKRIREPADFECSLFMASLRRRPCLSVYYTCPWFYPHCLSLLTVLNQFTDILLFILAVGVWSPCIVGMELCRAIMCCCLCTG